MSCGTFAWRVLLWCIVFGTSIDPPCAFAAITLELDSEYSPPSPIPSDPRDLIYSAPAMDHMLEPVKVRVLDGGGNLVNDSVTVIATTVLASNAGSPGNPGDTYNGTLCQHNLWTHRFLTCRYTGDNCTELSCNSSDPSYPLGKVEVVSEDGVAEFPRLLHTEPSTNGQRIVRFYAEHDGSSDEVETNAFDVDLQAAKLEITSAAQGNVDINEPMMFTVQTMAEDPSSPGTYINLTTGRHSALHVDLSIAWDEKEFYVFHGADVNMKELLRSTHILAGTDVALDGNFDLSIRKQCSDGMATFTDVRILTAATEIRLNFTQTLPYYPWERWPPDYSDTLNTTPSYTFYTLSDGNMPPGVAFTPAFNVTIPEMHSLAIDSDSITNFISSAEANFALKYPVNVQALDANGRVITDGPNSQLNITAMIDPSDACLSEDSGFTLSQGEGVFPGSICRPGENVRLSFTTTSSNGTTMTTASWTPQLNVTGELLVAGIFSTYAEINNDVFLAAAVDLINSGHWSQEFVDQGRTFRAQYFFSPSANPQDTIAIYDEIRQQNTDVSQPTIRAIIGSTSDDDTVALSTISKRHEMPIIGYLSETSVLSEKSSHPYFSRVSFGDKARFFAEGAYLASHHWNKVIVIKDSDHPIPGVMYEQFELHGVSIVLEVTIPGLESADYTNLKPLDTAAEQIFNSGTKVIYVYTFSPNDIYLYLEAMRLEFAPVYGFQWFMYSHLASSFPTTNAVADCATAVPYTCTTAFNTSLFLFPGLNADLEDEVWDKYLYPAFTRVDPLSIPASTLWRWPSVLGGLSKGHDAAVAILLGAMEIIDRNETITGPSLSTWIRNVSFTGGSGYISFDDKGDRPGYSATIYNWLARTTHPTITNDLIFAAGSWEIDPVTLEAIEYQTTTRLLAGGATEQSQIAYAPISYYNTRRIMGYEEGSTTLTELVSQVPAGYYCSQGCGGGLNTTFDTIYNWNHGTCVGMETCDCKTKANSTEPGYAGSSCQQILCDPQCRNGQCIEPDVCQCESGWTGADCGIPVCASCNGGHGNCTGPEICTCDSEYFGNSCAQKCTCKNGVCNDGQGGDGTCSSCDGDFVGADCEVSLSAVILPTFVGLALIITAIIVITVWYIRRMKFRAALANNDWIVDYNDVIIVMEKVGASSAAFRSMVSMQADNQRQKDVVRNQGKWNSTEVAIKMLDKESVVANTQIRLEVKAMRDIRHQNFASFVGACLDSPNVCVLMETAPKGSLDDILSADAINLDWNFKFSMLKDICRGMNYLSNTPIKSHGRLKSSNCVVDNRWTLKITDYGLHLFKSGQQGVPKFNPALGPGQNRAAEEDMEEGGVGTSAKAALLYTAPEILRTGVTHLDHVGKGTIQGDMYSMAIIMAEVLTHEAPFNDLLDYLEVTDVLEAVSGERTITAQLPQAWPRTESSAYLRPTLPEDCDPPLRKLLESIWVEDPMERPTFQQVLKSLNSLSPQKGDLMDNLVNMLEKYSTNLEAIVAERTEELAAEQAKTEELVCRMLPRAIAEQLKTGQPVNAETFECVTIYFSDIVGFTRIAGNSTPLQVVDLLNDLYTCFDAIIDHFDVYKVETIGDAYMVVSGLPIRNGDQHAGEIASMSLHLLSAILSFKIRHMPEESMQLRIGIHSGPAVAGVVGLKMPRYCLFGDTVNTASRMESGGFALRIHMSETTADLLQKLGGYHLISRGQREVKGKGVMTTYWLKTKDGFNRPLPTEDMAVSESQHEFK